MKKRLISLLLAFMLTLSLLTAPSLAGDGHRFYRSYTYQPAQSLGYTLNTYLHASAGREEEHVLTAQAGYALRPYVVSSDTLFKKGLTLSDAVAALEAQGLSVVAGMNASFFSTANSIPVGMLVQNGELITDCGGGQPTLGFAPDGSALIAQPYVVITGEGGGRSFAIDALNRERSAGKLHLFTDAFGDNTFSSYEGLHVVVQSADTLRIGGTVQGVVTRRLTGKDAVGIGTDEFVLSAYSEAAIARFAHLEVGMSVSISATTQDARWSDVVTAVSGLQYLVRDGRGLNINESTRAPRSAVGLLEDGSVLLYTVDGRRAGHSNGLTRAELGARLAELGCVTAIEMDGGGSSIIGVRMPGESSFGVVNRISEATERKCADFLLLCNTSPVLGDLAQLLPQPAYVSALPNTLLDFTLLGIDANHHPVTVTPSARSSAADSSVGIADGLQFFTLQPGQTELSFDNGYAIGHAEVTVVDRIDTLSLFDAEQGMAVSQLFVAPGSSTPLEARALLDTLPVASSPSSYEWRVEGDIGQIDAEGVFTAAATIGTTGRILCTALGLTAELPVQVGAEPTVLESFEDGLGLLSGQEAQALVEPITSRNEVLRGRGSAAVTYLFLVPEEGSDPTAVQMQSVVIPVNRTLRGSPSHFYMTVKGDGTGTELALRVIDRQGLQHELPVTTLDFTDTRIVGCELPPGCQQLSSLVLHYGGGATETRGRLLLDQWVLSWSALSTDDWPSSEIGAPVVNEAEGTLRFTVRVGQQNSALPPELSVRWDGEPLTELAWDAATGSCVITLPLPLTDRHLLTVELADVFGRRRRVQYDYGRERYATLDSLQDIDGHWGVGAIDFLDARGILDVVEEFGFRYFQPSRALTRMEMLRMMSRALALDITQYSHVELPFTDIAELGEEDLLTTKAMYANGFVSGMLMPDGSRQLGHDTNITRCDFSVILSRILPQGYGDNALDGYSDRDAIPGYARVSMGLLVSTGVMSGYDNKLMPMNDITRAEAASLIFKLFF